MTASAPGAKPASTSPSSSTSGTDFDAIVIGSGAGGLAAAVALQQAGKRTIVLEQHYHPGGWCHSFDLEGYRFSPGVHYIGECQPGGRTREVYEGLGVSQDLEMLELDPKGFDRVHVAGERFDIPRGKDEWRRRLQERFPRDARGIYEYVETVDRLNREVGALATMKLPWDLLTLPWKAPTTARWGMSSLQSLMDAHVKDPVLKAILAAQSGDHGLPPSMAPAPVHAAMAAHYFEGGYYPRGGGASIPRAFIHALKRAGGKIRVRTSVDKILLEKRGGKQVAIGVKLKDGTELRAPIVISNADPAVTFNRLIGRDKLSYLLRARLAATRWSVSAISLFLAVDMDPRSAGMTSANVWHYDTPDIDGIYKLGMDPKALDCDQPPGFFVTCTTLKDPSKLRKGHHTLEAFAFVPWQPFQKWASSRFGERPEDYMRLKKVWKQRMLRAVGRVIPGIEKHVVFADLGTPLSNVHYCESSFGNLYGTEKSRLQVGPLAFQTRTEFGGLYLCGASTLSHGVFGAHMSGLFAAARALRVRTKELLRPGGAPLRVYPCEDISQWPEALQKRVAASKAAAAKGPGTGPLGAGAAAGSDIPAGFEPDEAHAPEAMEALVA